MKTNLARQSIMVLMVTFDLALLAPTEAAAAEVGKTCGGMANIPCNAGLWCELQAGRCGDVDVTGKCIKVPELCPLEVFGTVCGCNKKNYLNDCWRQKDLISKSHDGECN
jgi:hypothetical protein